MQESLGECAVFLSVGDEFGHHAVVRFEKSGVRAAGRVVGPVDDAVAPAGREYGGADADALGVEAE